MHAAQKLSAINPDIVNDSFVEKRVKKEEKLRGHKRGQTLSKLDQNPRHSVHIIFLSLNQVSDAGTN